ncbi:hypothetical protein ACH42_05255 [Endozoicomonas sp. (ex Bugula neritina AB1)]|nr:hypothetical protein ACH42_05255 [Endozoicomonas sp. (ex Bugula neritina AB1)]
MENIYNFEHLNVGNIRLIVMNSQNRSFYLVAQDIARLLPNIKLTQVTGSLFHRDQVLNTTIIPVQEVLPLLNISTLAAANTLATRLESEIIPQVLSINQQPPLLTKSSARNTYPFEYGYWSQLRCNSHLPLQ